MGLISSMIAIGTALGVGGAGMAAGLTGALVTGSALYGAGTLLTNATRGPDNSAMYDKMSAATGNTADSIIAQSQAAAAEERKDLIRSKRRKTVLTGPTGLFEEADTAQKTLLGA